MKTFSEIREGFKMKKRNTGVASQPDEEDLKDFLDNWKRYEGADNWPKWVMMAIEKQEGGHVFGNKANVTKAKKVFKNLASGKIKTIKINKDGGIDKSHWK